MTGGYSCPGKQLVKMGKIKPSQEAIDMFMSTGDRCSRQWNSRLREHGHGGHLLCDSHAQPGGHHALRVPAPAPSKQRMFMEELFVKKSKLLEDEYLTILRNNIKVRKDIEHGTKKELSGKELDQLLSDAQK
jgi:hypothetical protein